MSEFWHAWYSAKAESAIEANEIYSEIPVYFSIYTKEPVEATFVTRTEEFDYFCEWDDLEYRGMVKRWEPGMN